MAPRKGNNGNNVFVGGAGAEAFDGVKGYDIVSYGNAPSSVRVDLNRPSTNTGYARGDTYKNIDFFSLSRSDDVFIGSTRNNSVNGDTGNDYLDGRNGNDTLSGHSGNDTLLGGKGYDAIWGGGDNDYLDGGANNDLLFGDGANDTLVGGTDSGSFTSVSLGGGGQFYRFSADILIPLNLIDDYGEWVVVPKYHAVEDAGAVTSLNRAGGDAIFVVTNGFNDARDWNAQRGSASSGWIDLGIGGKIGADSSIIFNTGSGNGNAAVRFSGTDGGQPGTQASGNNPEGVVTVAPVYGVAAVAFGDNLTGGTGADTFVFNAGDGVDLINDFTVGTDHIDIASNWFDGSAANGEFVARSYGNGAMILFSDTSADGFVNNTGVYLAGVQLSDINAALFI